MDYPKSYRKNGAAVEVENCKIERYLRSTYDNKLRDNLTHLFDYDWI
jgi:hypothetical protein